MEAEDAECEDELDGVGGAELSQKDVALMKAALDAAGETAHGDEVAALEAAATASDDDARSVTAGADAGGAGAMDVDAWRAQVVSRRRRQGDVVLRPEESRRLGRVAAAEAHACPCASCGKAIKRRTSGVPMPQKERPATSGRARDARARRYWSEQIEEEKVKACNLVMDEATGCGPTATCFACWRAVYHELRLPRTCHAVIGPDETPCSLCQRTKSGTPYSAAVSSAIQSSSTSRTRARRQPLSRLFDLNLCGFGGRTKYHLRKLIYGVDPAVSDSRKHAARSRRAQQTPPSP